MNIPDFSKAAILVIGDVMLDQYYTGRVSRISPEAPVPVVKIQSCRYALGGAANVSNNIAGLGARSFLIGTAGKDGNRKIMAGLLKKIHIEDLLIQTNTPTITKLRIVGEHQQIARLDFEEAAEPSEALINRIEKQLDLLIGRVQAVIISDYAKGLCSPALCRKIIAAARKYKKPVIIDPKGNDWEKYRNAFLVSPNLKELGEISGKDIKNNDAEIEKHGREILKKYSFNNLLVTRSERGMSLIMPKNVFHIPTEARDVYDVSGAGDTVIAALSAGIACGMNLADAVRLANKAAGIVVGKFGTVPINKKELVTSFEKKEESKIMPLPKLLNKVKEWKKDGKTIVFTNGCFDILHRGHVEYLRKAKEMGDVLIIGLNTDASTRRLKGKSRPVNNENDRAEVLSALEVTDAVVLFGEDTPARLIRSVRPDILVKGGDYKAEDVIGREFAGRTAIIPFLKGYSTTNTIKKMEAGKS